MSKKDYEAIAAIIKKQVDALAPGDYEYLHAESLLPELASDLAQYFKIRNPNFNHEKFLLACGV